MEKTKIRKNKVNTKQDNSKYKFAEKIFNNRKDKECDFPLIMEVHNFVDMLLSILFPHFSNKEYISSRLIESDLIFHEGNLINILKPTKINLEECFNNVNLFFNKLSETYELLLLDADAIFLGDPAAKSIDEVILTYPGFYAIALYRIAHDLYNSGIDIIPSLITEYSHQRTGIDIHPAAKIGKSFFIDHGTGIVIGETTEIGDNVKIYQGVTLGALSVDKIQSNQKRHPTIENNVIIYSNATKLGGNTIIGKNSIIGGNVWLTQSVEPFSMVYHKSEIKLINMKEESKYKFPEPINFVI